jgi:hypothetical protein
MAMLAGIVATVQEEAVRAKDVLQGLISPAATAAPGNASQTVLGEDVRVKGYALQPSLSTIQIVPVLLTLV